MLGLDTIVGAGFLVLAGTQSCTVPAPPRIAVNPVTAPIVYEYRLSSAELAKFKTDTVNPYAPGTDTTTGGLRQDRPKITTKIQWGESFYPARQESCFWYESVTVTIALSPKIYIAADHKEPLCRRAILEHETRHVDTDRTVINGYAQEVGKAVKKAVDGAGGMGPYGKAQAERVKEQLVQAVQSAVESQGALLEAEMARQQGQVDTLEEYERISAICDRARR